MSIEPVLNADLGIFKIVARNKKGQTVTRCRVFEATTPMAPDSPEAVDISDTEILLRWKQPSYDAHAPVICYSLQYKEADDVEWFNLANNIDHEFWRVTPPSS
uniref:Muscle M-line assembly protein unc-89 n=1 Tax=Cacopsylla melanoneura TaxID=428564 RepID=A0A8D9ASD4_9HEMI